ncbi:hypothetical protein BDA96_10G218800, partial [Sorghum bicolor]
ATRRCCVLVAAGVQCSHPVSLTPSSFTGLLAALGQSWRLRVSLLHTGGDENSGSSTGCSRVSDLISLIGAIVRMARDDAAMARLLGHGDIVVVCPKRNTSFISLFAELSSTGGQDRDVLWHGGSATRKTRTVG